MTRMPTYFLPHGGGPCFFMDPLPGFAPDAWDEMETFLRGIDKDLGERPKAVLVISAHWQTEQPTINRQETPPLLYDYYGFPDHTYKLTYPVKGDLALADRVESLLKSAGYAPNIETKRGLDHGVFIPFKLIYPDADVPMIQISFPLSSDPKAQMKFGEALAPLRDEGVLIATTGLSFHNLRAFFGPAAGKRVEASFAFDSWLQDAVTDIENREEKLKNWASAPGAKESHPEDEHFLPLLIAAGAAKGEPASIPYAGEVHGTAQSGYRFG